MAPGRTSAEPPARSSAVASPAAERSRRAFAASETARVKVDRWWLWPHVLGLDAPLVALAWQDWWGRAVYRPPAPSQRVILGLGVWLIYLADRLADSARGSPGEGTTARHAFAGARRFPLLLLATAIALALTALAPLLLPPDQFRHGLVLLAAASAYFWSIHRKASPRWTRYLPKEAVVGGMFALGTVFFVLCGPVPMPGRLVTAVVLFGAACFLNCALITAWECHPCDRRDPASLLNAFPALADGGLCKACWGLALAAGALGWGWRAAIFAPVALAAVLLAALDRWRGRFSANALRCLVDLVLLTPSACLGAAAVFS